MTKPFMVSISFLTLMTGRTSVAHEYPSNPLYRYLFTAFTAFTGVVSLSFMVRASISFWNFLRRDFGSDMSLPLMAKPRNLNQCCLSRYSTFFGLRVICISLR